MYHHLQHFFYSVFHKSSTFAALKTQKPIYTMKKLFSLLLCCMLTFVASAQVYYLIPSADKSAAEITSTDLFLPAENGQQPERNAYTWFCSQYDTDRIVTVKDVIDGKLLTDGALGSVQVLWINVARVGLALSQFDSIFSPDFRNQLKLFVQAGGNLYLSSQATRLVSEIGRCSWWPSDYQNGDYATSSETDVWYITFNFCTGADHASHAVYATMTDKGQIDGVDATFPLQAGTQRTNNNTGWVDWNFYWTNTGHSIDTDPVPGGCDAARRSLFEDTQHCQILGGWGHTRGLDYAGFIEFFPHDTYKGTVIAMGLAAYQWCTANNRVANVQNLTRGVLDYLSLPYSLAWSADAATTATIGSTASVTATADSPYTITYASESPATATISESGSVQANYFGDATLTATINAGDGVTFPKQSRTISRVLTVNGGAAAAFGYVLPYSPAVMAAYDNEESLQPDYHTYRWFLSQYVQTGKGCFINPAEMASIPSEVEVLWIHNDHVGLASQDYYDALGGDTFREALRTYLNAGHNVFLSKQATRLVGDLGRNDFPSYNNAGYGTRDAWRVGNQFFTDDDRIDVSSHPVYTAMGTNTTIMAAGNHTDNNDVWQNFAEGTTATDRSRFTDYEQTHNCRILGGWGHDTENYSLECIGLVEYLPQTNLNGTVVAMGLAAYQWGMTNDEVANPSTELQALQTLTSNILTYLQSPLSYTYTRTDLFGGQYGTICIPQAVATTANSGATFYSIEKANFDDASRLVSIDLVEQTSLSAGVPYIFATDADATEFTLTISNIRADAAGTANGLVGTFEDITVPANDNNWILNNNQIRLCGEGNTTPANRAYIHVADIADQSATTPAGVRRLSVRNADYDDTTTDLPETTDRGSSSDSSWGNSSDTSWGNSSDTSWGDFSDNSRTTPEATRTIYNVLGQRVASAPAGLYIIDGRKVLVTK